MWSYDAAGAGTLARTGTLAGARAIAVSPDGELAMVAGAGLSRSSDAGATWTPLAVEPGVVFEDVRLAEDGSAVAVGADGVVASIDPAGGVSLQHVGAASLHTLHLPDPDSIDTTGYAAGDGGQVWITHDAGATWTAGPALGRAVYGVDEISAGHR